MKLFATPQFLMAPETEGAGGGDRSSALEQRFDQLSKTLETVITNDRQRAVEAREQQFAAAEEKLNTALSNAASKVDAAERDLAAALEDGDAAVIAKSQRALAETAATHTRVQAEVDAAKAELRDMRERRSQPAKAPVDTKNLDAWKAANRSWYGIDDEMTKAAHAIDATIRSAGVLKPGTPDYFDAIDRQMRQKFPDRLQGSPGGHSRGGGGAGGSGADGTIRIPESVVEGWRRMGFDVDDQKTVDRLLEARKTAVSKGLLPEQPATGKVMVR